MDFINNNETLEKIGFAEDRILQYEDYEFPHICLVDATERQHMRVLELIEDQNVSCIMVMSVDEYDFQFLVIAPMTEDKLRNLIAKSLN